MGVMKVPVGVWGTAQNRPRASSVEISVWALQAGPSNGHRCGGPKKAPRGLETTRGLEHPRTPNPGDGQNWAFPMEKILGYIGDLN